MKITGNVIYNIRNKNSNVNNNSNKKINVKNQLASILESVKGSFEIRCLANLERKDGYLRGNYNLYAQ